MTKICKNCVLPESSTIVLDEKGICNICNSEFLSAFGNIKPNKVKLLESIERVKERGQTSDYDCVVGWSGGRDSTTLLYELVNTHKLRCVAVFGKTPYTPPEIIENVRNISKILGVRLIEFNTPANHLEVAKYCMKIYVKTKAPILVNLACSPCKSVNNHILKQASKLNVKTMIYGGNRFEEMPLGPASVEIKAKDRFSFVSMLKDSVLRIYKGFGVLVAHPKLLKYFFTIFKASVLYVNPYTVYLRLRYPRIDRFDYYFLADWDEKRVIEVLKELNWKLPSGCNSTWRADCVFESIKNKVFEHRVGFTYTHAMYSNLIRAGKISRIEAVNRIKTETVSEERLKEALKIIQLPEDFMIEI